MLEGFWLYSTTIILMILGLFGIALCYMMIKEIIIENKKEKKRIERRKNYVQKR